MFKRNDMISDVTDYLKKNLRKGYTKESLKWALINQGYSRIEVDKAIERADKELANEAPILNTKPQIERIIEPVAEEEKGFWKRFFSW